MREMKDSGIEWVGAIPAAWGVHRIASHFQEIKEKNTANAYSNALQFKMGKIIAKPQKWDEDETNETYSAYTVVHPNTIMINGLNLEFDFVTQRVARVECNGIITSAYIALSTRDDINAEYICYLLKSYDACRAFHSMGRGLRKILSYSELKDKPIVVPPLAEQERIAAFLDAECAEIDTVLEKTRSSIEEYKKLKQAAITQAVTKGIRGDRPMKDSGIEWIGEISQDFEIVKLKWLCDVLDQFRSPVTADKRNQNADVLYDYYGASGAIDKIDGYTIDDHVMLIGEDGANLRMRNLPIMYEINGKAWVNNHAHILKPKAGVDFYFIFYALEALDLNYYITGSAQPKLSQDNLRNIWVPITDFTGQKRIAAYISDVCDEFDCLIAKKQQYLTEIENYKKSLIYEYVTGKKEVV